MTKKQGPMLYFYLNGNLHKRLSSNRTLDELIAWDYVQKKRVWYSLSDVKKRAGRAFTMKQVGEMIGRHRVNIERHLLKGGFPRPQMAIKRGNSLLAGTYYFSEQDIYNLHDYLMTVHVGSPRKDGKITPGNLPSKAELRAMIKHDIVTYVKLEDGSFVPTWKEIDW